MEVTIEITSFCPFYCEYCSSNSSLEGKHLPYEEIKKFLESQRNINRINISGGEPLAHPDFYRILMLCYSFTNDVRVYTNMLTHVIYNSDIIKEIKIEANVCILPGKNVYIPKNVNKVHLLKLVHQGRAKNYPKQKVVVSRNFYDINACKECTHTLLQADGQIVKGPCKKTYGV